MAEALHLFLTYIYLSTNEDVFSLSAFFRVDAEMCVVAIVTEWSRPREAAIHQGRQGEVPLSGRG